MTVKQKLEKCKICPTMFAPRTRIQNTCGLKCSLILVNIKQKEKAREKSELSKKIFKGNELRLKKEIKKNEQKEK